MFSWINDALKDAGVESVADGLGSIICYAMSRGNGRTLKDDDLTVLTRALNIVREIRELAQPNKEE